MASSLQQQAENGLTKSLMPQKHNQRRGCCCLLWRLPGWAVILLIVIILVLASTVTYLMITCHSGELPAPRRTDPAQCPEEMIRINTTCYFLSERRASWGQSQAMCNQHGGSLLIIRPHTENDLQKLNVNDDFWIGLKKDGNSWKWADGGEYNETIHNDSRLNCAYLNGQIMVLACDTPRRFICSKPVGG